MDCVTTPMFSILIIGVPTGKIIPHCGLQQGDPLSPYLFLMCSKALSTLISGSSSTKRITGIKPGRHCPPITHLFFVDDRLLFCSGKLEEVWHVRRLLSIYENASGQAVNFNKSALCFSPNVNEEFRCVLSDFLALPIVFDLGRYLDVPTTFTRRRSDDCNPIKERVWRTLQGWKGNLFSVGAKKY